MQMKRDKGVKHKRRLPNSPSKFQLLTQKALNDNLTNGVVKYRKGNSGCYNCVLVTILLFTNEESYFDFLCAICYFLDDIYVDVVTNLIATLIF